MMTPDEIQRYTSLPKFIELQVGDEAEQRHHFKAWNAVEMGNWFSEGTYVTVKDHSPIAADISAGLYKVTRREVAFYGDIACPEDMKHIEGNAYLLITIDRVGD